MNHTHCVVALALVRGLIACGPEPLCGSDGIVHGDAVLRSDYDVGAMRGCNIVDGSLFIQPSPRVLGWRDEVHDLMELASLTTVNGDVFITTTAALTSLRGLDSLEGIGGGLTIRDDLQAPGGVRDLTGLGSLIEIGGDVEVCATGPNAVFAFAGVDSLARVGGTLRILGPDIFCGANVVSLVGLSRLASVGGIAIQHLAGLESLNGLDALGEVGDAELGVFAFFTAPTGILLEDNPRLERVSLPSLTAVVGGFEISGAPMLGTIDVPKLQTVGGEITLAVEKMTNMDGFSALENAGGIFIRGVSPEGASYNEHTRMASLTGLSRLTSLQALGIADSEVVTLGGLEGVRGSLDSLVLWGNANLVDLTALDGLRSLRMLGLVENAALVDLAGLGELTSLGPPLPNDFGSESAALLIISNASLQTLGDLANVVTIDGPLAINDNPALPACEALQLAARFEVPCECTDNDDTGVCP